MDFLDLILSIILVGAIGGLVIWIVGKLNLGLTVDGFGPAFIAAFVIAIVGGVLAWLLGLFGVDPGQFGGFLGGILNLIVAAIVLMLSGAFVKGMAVNGFMGALVGAVAIGVVTWLVDLVLRMF